MKKGIHPDYHPITVKMTNGETFETRSTYGKEGEVLQLDVDPHTHPAWTGGGAFINKKAGKVADFNKRFGNIGLSSAKKPAKEAAKPAAKKEKTQDTKDKAKAAKKDKPEAPKAKETAVKPDAKPETAAPENPAS